MTDCFSEEKRSAIMRAVGQSDTAPELRLRRSLWSIGLRYRLGRRIAGCRPDFVFVGPQVAVFVDGCFWHGCPIHYTPPKTRRDFWKQKLEENRERDRRNVRDLKRQEWKALRFWECEVTSDLPAVVAQIGRTVALHGTATPSQG